MKEKRETVTIRPWSMEDAPFLAGQINDPNVLRYLTAQMPNPYHLEDAQEYLTKSREDHSFNRCVLVNGEVAGGMGLSATHVFGYWLGVSVSRAGDCDTGCKALPAGGAAVCAGLPEAGSFCL